MIGQAPSYAPKCGLDRKHRMVFCENCGPENVWCLDCHNRICGMCNEQLNYGIWMHSFSGKFIYEGCERQEKRFCNLEDTDSTMCNACKVVTPKLDDA